MFTKRSLGILLTAILIGFVLIIDPMVIESEAKSTKQHQCQTLSPIIDIQIDDLQNQEPKVAYNSLHGEYLVVWFTEQGPFTTDIWAARVNRDGKVISKFNVASSPGKKRWQPVVAYSSAQDQYLIVYSLEVSSEDFDLYASRVNWNGAWISQEFPVRVETGKQWLPSITYNSQDDEYLVVYSNLWPGGMEDIAAQRVRAVDGNLESWANVATGVGEDRSRPDVAYNHNRNEYLIAYDFVGYSPSHPPQIRGKVAMANLMGISPKPESILCCEPTGSPQQAVVAVASGPNDYLITFWNGILTAPIYARRVALTGEALGPSGGFPLTQSTPLSWTGGDIGYAGYGYLASWFSQPMSTPTNYNVYGCQVMVGQDQAAGIDFIIDSNVQNQEMAQLACSPHGECLVVYQDNSPDGKDYEIRGRFVKLCPLVFVPLILQMP